MNNPTYQMPGTRNQSRSSRAAIQIGTGRYPSHWPSLVYVVRCRNSVPSQPTCSALGSTHHSAPFVSSQYCTPSSSDSLIGFRRLALRNASLLPARQAAAVCKGRKGSGIFWESSAGFPVQHQSLHDIPSEGMHI